MPFSFTNKNAGDLIRSQDWNEALSAITALYDRLHPTTGHTHSGSAEEGPQIDAAGIADLAVITTKLADLAVATAKLQDDAVITQKIAPNAVDGTRIAPNAIGNGHLQVNSVGVAQILADAINTGKLADGAVTNPKLADGSVSASKLAPGTIPEYGFLTGTYYDGQTIAVPTGFLRSECIYHAAFGSISANLAYGGTRTVNIYIDGSGLISLGEYRLVGSWPIFFFQFFPADEITGNVSVLTIAKRGGW